MLAHNPRLKGILLASFTALLWGFLAIALKVAVNFAAPATIVWFRFLTAFVLLAIYLLLIDRSKLEILRHPPILMLSAAICLGINYFGFMQGIQHTTPAVAQIIIQSGPVILALVGVIFYRERLTLRQASGFIIAGVGFLLFYRLQINSLLSDRDSFNQGIGWIVIAALCWVLYATATKKMVREWSAQQINLIIYGFCALLFIPFVQYPIFLNLSLWQWILMFFLGINTLLAYGFLAASFKYIEANKISIIITLNPVITLITMSVLTILEVHWITPEKMALPSLLGAGIVLSGVILAVKSGTK